MKPSVIQEAINAVIEAVKASGEILGNVEVNHTVQTGSGNASGTASEPQESITLHYQVSPKRPETT